MTKIYSYFGREHFKANKTKLHETLITEMQKAYQSGELTTSLIQKAVTSLRGTTPINSYLNALNSEFDNMGIEFAISKIAKAYSELEKHQQRSAYKSWTKAIPTLEQNIEFNSK